MSAAPPRILIVEDEPDIRSALDDVCASEGVEPHAVGTIAAAKELAAAEPFDAVLLDVRLPDGDGLALLESLHAGAATASLPVIILTGLDEPELVRRAFLAGASDYVRKPVSVVELVSRLHAAVRRGREARRREVFERRVVDGRLLQSQRVEALGLLAGMTAHDFNNIVSAIVGFTELTLASPALAPELRRNVLEIQRASEQGAELARQLLDLAKRHATPELSVVPVDEVVARSLELLRRLAGRGVLVEARLGAPGVAIFGDAARLEQVVMNLVANARDAMPAGGAVTITTAEVRRGDGRFVVLRVRDTGVGISEAARPRIFEPFFTTKKERGTGLGLAVVRSVVEQLRGEIAVASREGVETTFTITLPVHRGDGTGDGAGAKERQGAAGDPPRPE